MGFPPAGVSSSLGGDGSRMTRLLDALSTQRTKMNSVDLLAIINSAVRQGNSTNKSTSTNPCLLPQCLSKRGLDLCLDIVENVIQRELAISDGDLQTVKDFLLLLIPSHFSTTLIELQADSIETMVQLIVELSSFLVDFYFIPVFTKLDQNPDKVQMALPIAANSTIDFSSSQPILPSTVLKGFTLYFEIILIGYAVFCHQHKNGLYSELSPKRVFSIIINKLVKCAILPFHGATIGLSKILSYHFESNNDENSNLITSLLACLNFTSETLQYATTTILSLTCFTKVNVAAMKNILNSSIVANDSPFPLAGSIFELKPSQKSKVWQSAFLSLIEETLVSTKQTVSPSQLHPVEIDFRPLFSFIALCNLTSNIGALFIQTHHLSEPATLDNDNSQPDQILDTKHKVKSGNWPEIAFHMSLLSSFYCLAFEVPQSRASHSLLAFELVRVMSVEGINALIYNLREFNLYREKEQLGPFVRRFLNIQISSILKELRSAHQTVEGDWTKRDSTFRLPFHSLIWQTLREATLADPSAIRGKIATILEAAAIAEMIKDSSMQSSKFLTFLIRILTQLADLDLLISAIDVFIEAQESYKLAGLPQLELEFLIHPTILDAFQVAGSSITPAQLNHLWQAWIDLLERQAEQLACQRICRLDDRTRVMNLSGLCIVVSQFIRETEVKESLLEPVISLISHIDGFTSSLLDLVSLKLPPLSGSLPSQNAISSFSLAEVSRKPAVGIIALVEAELLLYRKIDSWLAPRYLGESIHHTKLLDEVNNNIGEDENAEMDRIDSTGNGKSLYSSSLFQNNKISGTVRRSCVRISTWLAHCLCDVLNLLADDEGMKRQDRRVDGVSLETLVDSKTFERLVCSISHFLHLKLLYPELFSNVSLSEKDLIIAFGNMFNAIQQVNDDPEKKHKLASWKEPLLDGLRRNLSQNLKTIFWSSDQFHIKRSTSEEEVADSKNKRRRLLDNRYTDVTGEDMSIGSVALMMIADHDLNSILDSVAFPDFTENTVSRINSFSDELQSSIVKLHCIVPEKFHDRALSILGSQISVRLLQLVNQYERTTFTESSVTTNEQLWQKMFSLILMVSGSHLRVFKRLISVRSTINNLIIVIGKVVKLNSTLLQYALNDPVNCMNQAGCNMLLFSSIILIESVRVLNRLLSFTKGLSIQSTLSVLYSFITEIVILFESQFSLVSSIPIFIQLWIHTIPEMFIECLNHVLRCNSQTQSGSNNENEAREIVSTLEAIRTLCSPLIQIHIKEKNSQSPEHVLSKSKWILNLFPGCPEFPEPGIAQPLERHPITLGELVSSNAVSKLLEFFYEVKSDSILSPLLSVGSMTVNIGWSSVHRLFRSIQLFSKNKTLDHLHLQLLYDSVISILTRIASYIVNHRKVQNRTISSSIFFNNFDDIQDFTSHFISLVIGIASQSTSSHPPNNYPGALLVMVQLLLTEPNSRFDRDERFTSVISSIFRLTQSELESHLKPLVQLQPLNNVETQRSLFWLSQTSLSLPDYSIHIPKHYSTSVDPIWITLASELSPPGLLNLIGFLSSISSEDSVVSDIGDYNRLALLDACCALTRSRTTMVRILRRLFPKVGDSEPAKRSGIASVLVKVLRTIAVNEESDTLIDSLYQNKGIDDFIERLKKLIVWTLHFSRVVQLFSNIHDVMKRCITINNAHGRWQDTFIVELLNVALNGSEKLSNLLTLTNSILEIATITSDSSNSATATKLVGPCFLCIEIISSLTCFAMSSAITVRRDLCNETSPVVTSLHYFIWKRITVIQHIFHCLLNSIIEMPSSRLALQLARQLTRLWSILFASSGSASTVLRRGASRIIPEVMSQRLRLSHATIATRSAMTEKVLRTIPNANKSNQKAIEDEERGWVRVMNLLKLSGLNPLLESIDNQFKRHLFADMDSDGRKNFQELHSEFSKFYSYRSQVHRV